MLGLKLILQTPVIGLGSLALLFLLLRIPYCPAAPITLVLSALVGWASGFGTLPGSMTASVWTPQLVIPTWVETWRSLELAVIPQLSLTLTNAVIVTAALARELFPETGAVASERNLSISSGLANVLLSPLGAMPMCHGAGGLSAQYRFGSRSGVAPIILGVVLLILAIAFADHAASLFGLVPVGAVGALLIFAGTDLAVSRRLFDACPSCWPVIGVAALVTLLVNPAIGLGVGWVSEVVRAAIVRRFAPTQT